MQSAGPMNVSRRCRSAGCCPPENGPQIAQIPRHTDKDPGAADAETNDGEADGEGEGNEESAAETRESD
jgi:hypothetical protein